MPQYDFRCLSCQKVFSLDMTMAEYARLEQLARELGTERSTLLKRALRRGAEDLMFERACQAYRAGEATLSRAAEMAGLPLRNLIPRLRDADLEPSCGVEEIEEDLRT
ncbi:MAG: UPF0175 family protein [Gemmatimonadota bacterium]